MQKIPSYGIALLALIIAACSVDAEGGEMDAAPVNEAVAGDSLLPMREMIARFQAEVPPADSFGPDAAPSREVLIDRFVAAVADSSAAALSALTLNVSEFAHLYFPTSMFARVPYAQPPAVNWLLLEQNSLKGGRRLLREYGGRRLDVEGHRCAGAPRVEGANRIWESCLLVVRGADGRIAELRLFGSIIEREGRYRLLSLANRL
ncbi:MAG TPA: hypothetical protein VFZ69_16255 [Longimicrobiales bacterium]